MFDFFFYGTLIDADIRRLVLRRDVPSNQVVTAVLAGYRRYSVHDAPYPAAVPEAGGEIDGIVLRGLGALDAARLSNFEGQDYVATLCPINLGPTGTAEDQTNETGPHEAWVFVASKQVPLTKNSWSVGAWQAAHKGRFLEVAHDWLETRGDDLVAAQERMWRARL